MGQDARTQVVNGFVFPASPGPGRSFRDDGQKWKAVAEALAYARSCLGAADRGMHRQLIGVESLALANLRDRGTIGTDLGEPPLPWLSGLPAR